MPLDICPNPLSIKKYIRFNSDVNYGVWVITTYLCRFINWNKCAILVQDIDNGGGYTCVGLEVFEKCWYPFLNSL